MIELHNPEDVRVMLLHMAAASSGEPDRRLRLAGWFRAALALLEDEDPWPAPPPVPRQALVELAFALSMAADHAAFIAERAGALTT